MGFFKESALGLAICAGGGARNGAEYFGEVIVIGNAYVICHLGYGKVCLGQEGLCSLNPALRNKVGKGFAAGKLLCKGAELCAAYVELAGYGGKGKLFHIMLLKIGFEQLQLTAGGAVNHALYHYVGSHSFKKVCKGVDFFLGILAELEKLLMQSFLASFIPVKGGEGVLPLILNRGCIKKLTEGKIGEGLPAGGNGNNGFANACMAAVIVHIAGFSACLGLSGIAVKAALMTLGGTVHGGAEGQMPLVKAYVGTANIQYIGADSRKGIQVGNKAQQFVSIKEYVHRTPLMWQRMKTDMVSHKAPFVSLTKQRKR